MRKYNYGYTIVKALDRLEEALAEPPSPLVRDACIQRFEFSFELGWKAIKESLKQQGLECQSPKSCLREAFRQGWIDDENAGIVLLDDRNLTSHTYDEELAEVIYKRLQQHLSFMQGLKAQLIAAD